MKLVHTHHHNSTILQPKIHSKLQSNSPFFRNKHPIRSMPIQQTQPRSSPKVISVPVHFISSHQSPLSTSKASAAALKIQTLFRGFLVRKSVKKIASIGNEVSEMERRIDEASDLIRRDAKERLRVNETLMSLLLKLDSIRGFDFGVRELRKTVTRKAIALQEKVDSTANQTLDSRCTSTTTETSGFHDEVVDVEQFANASSKKRKEDHHHHHHHHHHHTRVVASTEVIVNKLMDDNEKMMKLMMQVTERNEMQARMINSLSRRVEQLEKAFMAETLKRKKKTRAALRRKRDGINAWKNVS